MTCGENGQFSKSKVQIKTIKQEQRENGPLKKIEVPVESVVGNVYIL